MFVCSVYDAVFPAQTQEIKPQAVFLGVDFSDRLFLRRRIYRPDQSPDFFWLTGLASASRSW